MLTRTLAPATLRPETEAPSHSLMMKHRSVLAALALVAACSSGPSADSTPTQPALAPIALGSVGDSVMYLEQTDALTRIARPNDTLRVGSSNVAVIHVMRTAPDTLQAFYEHLVLRFETPTQSRNVDTQALLGPRFVMHENRGRVTTVATPDLPNEIRQLTDLRRQFDDFFLRLPATPLTLAQTWVDTVRFAAEDGEGSTQRSAVTRFTARADTVVEGLAALVIDYTSVIEASVRSAPTTSGTLLSTLIGEESGSFVYAPGREVMLRRVRHGLLEGELVIEGGLEPLRFPQTFRYDSRIELLPPVQPGAPRPAAPTRLTPQP